MKVTIDPRYNISPDGRIFGIELLNASEQIGKSDVLSLFDESTGKAVEVSLRP